MLVFRALILSILAIAALSEVVQLTSKNFEHLTQASTGATTGDWLIEFYAPWCGHCKSLMPTYEKVSQTLAGEVNVASVDVPANRELGTRFEIKGFPTILFLSKGKVYAFKGRRTVDDIVEFVRHGYQIQNPEAVPEPVGYFGEFILLGKQTIKNARKDILAGKFLTVNVMYIVMPIIFLVLLIVTLVIPVPAPEVPVKKTEKAE